MILCAGESLIDMVPEDGAFRPLAGGAVYNTTVALGRLGEPTAYLWPISRDPFGEVLLRPLIEAGVNTDLCPRSDRLTTLALVTLTGGEARYSFYDEGSAGRMLSQNDIPELPGDVQAIFAGGISLVPDPCGGAIESLIQRNHHRLPVMLDPNIFDASFSAFAKVYSKLNAQPQLFFIGKSFNRFGLPSSLQFKNIQHIKARAIDVISEFGKKASPKTEKKKVSPYRW